ncbi:UNVERIFIED_CONTAM: BAG family molecular chaperone regulator 5, mitochondrial [Sesamum radiatum]|uniref:BAG family molecular chaperone regulator 5, mitochondrial n=1 Tax=Sesamum radiatum TaxID=300843 RepID=A0AAW2RYI6_SESRA
MDAPFFNNRVWYQQPDPSLRRFPPSAPFRGVPVYQVDPVPETHRSTHPVRRPPGGNPGPKVVQIPIHFVGSEEVDRSGSALKIQKVFRGFLVRKCLRKIKDIKVQVDEIEERLSTSEVRDLVRRDERERVRMNESLMSLLFKLDSISGVDIGVRGCRKAVIRKVIALQEKIDAIVAIDLVGNAENCETVDQEAEEIKVPVMTAGSNQNDEPKDSFENGDDSEGTEQCQEITEDVSCGGRGNEAMGVEGNDGEIEIDNIGVDQELKVNEANYGENGVDTSNLDLVKGSLDGVKEYSSETVENDKVGEPVESTNEGKGADDNKGNRELLERMVEENEKMMRMMTQLFERNEAQTRMLNALTHRVGLLEKAFVCDRLRKKKKCKAACRED